MKKKRFRIGCIVVFLVCTFLLIGVGTYSEIQVRQHGKSSIAEVVDMKEYTSRGGKTYEIKYKVDGETHTGSVSKKVYKRLDIGSRIEVVEYKGKTMLFESYGSK
ncbi:hypothetical protein [Bacillus mycoides]|uniref:hypothetical protein n=1 Tax=Bacillus mycoides TaxID=1405 RepID=UPI00032F3B7F|nr:hypothetical protein [Bacillus mycoides]EOO34737.1 hypothetical protein IKK_05362 [Bacillus mycoides]MDI6533835.1 hypothetical protein [Bacillus mycoides]MED1042804.1 hypothetical protein [Bacillus mycoides]QWH97970.1 hypothetical protein EXW36_28095 [Bacillus mycoides]WJE61325.1 hypothetical protein QRE64_29655 [Bacillus mycoides]